MNPNKEAVANTFQIIFGIVGKRPLCRFDHIHLQAFLLDHRLCLQASAQEQEGHEPRFAGQQPGDGALAPERQEELAAETAVPKPAAGAMEATEPSKEAAGPAAGGEKPSDTVQGHAKPAASMVSPTSPLTCVSSIHSSPIIVQGRLMPGHQS